MINLVQPNIIWLIFMQLYLFLLVGIITCHYINVN